MRKFKTVFMRGGICKGCMFHKEDLPENHEEWDSIFLQVMGNPDPKQMDGLGGTISSNNKVVVVWKSEEANVDVEYLVGQVVVGKNQVDYKSNCGNMTIAVGPFAVEEGIVDIVEPATNIRMLNRNTDKYINAVVPIEDGTFAQTGDFVIAGVEGTAAEVKLKFMNPSGSKTGKLLPTGNVLDILEIEGVGSIEATILDVSNPMVLVRAEDIGLKGTELPEEVNTNKEVCSLLEKIRGTAACIMGFAKDLEDAEINSPAVPKVGFVTSPKTYIDIEGKVVKAEDIDVCVRIMSIFECHKASPLTSANATAVAALLEGSTAHNKLINDLKVAQEGVRIGHPSGVTTIYPEIIKSEEGINLSSVGVQGTARRIMDGTVYIRK